MLQTRYSDEFADLDGQGYGFRFETAPVHPLFPAVFVGWEDGPSFKREHSRGTRPPWPWPESFSATMIMAGSPFDGTAALCGNTGISDYDRRHVREGVRRGAEWLAEAGAFLEIFTSTIPVRCDGFPATAPSRT